MKQNLTTVGRVELTHEEIAEAAITYIDKNKKVNDAIDAWLATKHHLSSTRIRYTKTDSGINSAVIDVRSSVKNGMVPSFADDPKQIRGPVKSALRPNVGIYGYLKELFADEIKKGSHSMTFGEVLTNVLFSYPKMSEKHLAIYLHDQRMLPSVRFSKKEGIVRF